MARADFAGQLVGKDAIVTYVFGGFARFTVVSQKTGTRYTYRLALPKDSKCKNCGEPLGHGARECAKCGLKLQYPTADPKRGPFFLKVLTGPDNEASYEFVGTVRRDANGIATYGHSAKSRISADAPSVRAAKWFLDQLSPFQPESSVAQAEVFHDGTCCRCGRALTVPESVASGIGPICAGRE